MISMASPVLDKKRENIKERYSKRKQKIEDPEQKAKLDRFDFMIQNHQLETDEKSLKRAQKCIVSYDLEAISRSEEAFLKAIRRNRERATLPYFFGILKNMIFRVGCSPVRLCAFVAQVEPDQVAVARSVEAREVAAVDDAHRQIGDALHGGDVSGHVGMIRVIDQRPIVNRVAGEENAALGLP